jgi:hypothetical protein
MMNTLKAMRFEEAPDYDYLRSLFRPFLSKAGSVANQDSTKTDEVVLSLELSQNVPDHHQGDDLIDDDDDDDEEVIITKIIPMKKASKRRSLPHSLKRNNSTSTPWSVNQMAMFKEHKDQVIQAICAQSLMNPTPAMLQQLAKMKKRDPGLTSMPNLTRRKGLLAKRRLTEPRRGGDGGKIKKIKFV